MGAANNTVTKKEIIDKISDRTKIRRSDVRTVIQEFLDEILRDLSLGRRLEFRDFGVFEVRERAARTAQNPKTLEPVPVPAKNTVKFKPGRRMKDALEHGPGFTGVQRDSVAEITVTDHASNSVLEGSANNAADRPKG